MSADKFEGVTRGWEVASPNGGNQTHEDKSIRKAKELIKRYPSVIQASLPWSIASSTWHAATLKGSVDLLRYMVDYLLEDPASPIPRHLTKDQKKDLLKEQLNSTNVSGHTPLMIAAARGHIDCLLFLIEMGADILKADQAHGMIPLHFAARAGKPESIRAILENIPPYLSFFDQERVRDIQCSSGLTALHFAVGFNHISCIDVLLSFKVSQIARTRFPTTELGWGISQGSTPLHVAAYGLNLPAAISLLTPLAIAAVLSPSTQDPRQRQNIDKQIPLRVAKRSAETALSANKPRGDIDLLFEILGPSTNLLTTLDVKMPDLGPPSLAAIAASAMRKKLMGDLEVASQATMFKRASSCQEQDDEEEEEEEEEFHEGEVEYRESEKGCSSSNGDADEDQDIENEFVVSPLHSPRSQEIEITSSKSPPSSINSIQATSPPHTPQPTPLIKSSSFVLITSYSAISPKVKSPLSRFGRPSLNAIHPEPEGGGSIGGADGSCSLRNTGGARRTHNSVAFSNAGADDLASIGRTASGRVSSRVSRGSGKKKTSANSLRRVTDEEDESCFICLDAAPEVGVQGCVHKLCKECAAHMIERLHLAPVSLKTLLCLLVSYLIAPDLESLQLTCPFCRKSVGSFVSI